jgi:hypothetical protein
MDRIDRKVLILRHKMNEIEAFYTNKSIPYFGEVVKLQIEEKIKKDRMDIVISLMNYDETQYDLLNDKLDIYNMFYDCVARLGLNIYEKLTLSNIRCK